MRNGVGRRALLAEAGLVGATALAASVTPAVADATLIRIGYIRSTDRKPTISLLDKPAPNDGLGGAMVAIDDNNTTGSFMNQRFELTDVPARPGADMQAALTKLTSQDVHYVLIDLPASDVLKLADAARGAPVVIFNVNAPDDSLRGADCRANVIHVCPSRAMLADALGQYLLWKKWTRVLMIKGEHPDDALLADAYHRTAKRFGLRIVDERICKDTGGSRQTDTGLLELQKNMPLLSQNAPEYDVLLAVDENEVFAGYLPYRTWDARPVVGSAGLEPVSWSASSQSFGGEQIQSRFERLNHRTMTPLDMQAWTAVRMVGETASRAGKLDFPTMEAYLKGPNFGVAAYKGKRLTLRDWDWQLRQPILLADGRVVVSISPQPGFLHQVTELDTLGVDRPEATCKLG